MDEREEFATTVMKARLKSFTLKRIATHMPKSWRIQYHRTVMTFVESE